MNKPDTKTLTSDTIVAFIENIFMTQGDREYLGEPVTISAHMLQSATLAERGGLDRHVVIAALLHDIGHFTSDRGTFAMNDTVDRLHEDAGADVLAPFFPEAVTECVRHHVAAKRYLCAKRPDYFDRLSDASVKSLELQGGPMSEDEMAAFEKLPYHAEIVQVRHLDDAGKDPAAEALPLSHFLPMLQELVDERRGSAPAA